MTAERGRGPTSQSHVQAGIRSVRPLAVLLTVLAVAATGCTPPSAPGELTTDLSPDVQICLLDQTYSTVDGTSFALSLHSEKPGMWTLDSVVGNPADGIAITRSWLVKEPDQKNPVFGFGFPVPPTKDNPAQVSNCGRNASRFPVQSSKGTQSRSWCSSS